MTSGQALPRVLQQLQKTLVGTHFSRDAHRLWSAAHLSRRAAVMALVYPDRTSGAASGLRALLTVRGTALSYGGDAALPGGRAETVSESFLDVAKREAREETGISDAQCELVGVLPTYASSRLHVVQPVLFYAPSLPVDAAKVDKREVSDVFSVALESLLDYAAPSENIDALMFREDSLLAGENRSYRVWGLTANVLIDCARLAYMKNPPYNFYRGKKMFIARSSAQDPSAIEKSVGNGPTLEYALRRGVLQKPLRALRASA